MQERPIGALVDSLVANGCDVTHTANKGCFPLMVFHFTFAPKTP